MALEGRQGQRIAVIGSGVGGLSAAWLLSRTSDVTVFEVDYRVGGHSNTVDVVDGDGTFPVDTGFIVFNEDNFASEECFSNKSYNEGSASECVT